MRRRSEPNDVRSDTPLHHVPAAEASTYEALQAMPQDQRDKWLATERKNQSWTANTVILHVSAELERI